MIIKKQCDVYVSQIISDDINEDHLEDVWDRVYVSKSYIQPRYFTNNNNKGNQS